MPPRHGPHSEGEPYDWQLTSPSKTLEKYLIAKINHVGICYQNLIAGPARCSGSPPRVIPVKIRSAMSTVAKLDPCPRPQHLPFALRATSSHEYPISNHLSPSPRAPQEAQYRHRYPILTSSSSLVTTSLEFGAPRPQERFITILDCRNLPDRLEAFFNLFLLPDS